MGNETLEVQKLSLGSYFLKFFNQDSQQIIKFIKE